MEKSKLKRLIDIAAGRVIADTVIKNCKIVDVYCGVIRNEDIAICDGIIAGIGTYEGKKIIDGKGMYAAPGFIDSHIHMESSYVRPEELGRLIVPHGTTTIIADPHEIGNVCGFTGIDYMIKASKGTALDVKIMLSSCVPATQWENSGACIDAEDMDKALTSKELFGIAEFMNYPGIINGDDEALEKILVGKKHDKIIDGHSPGLSGKGLDAYISVGIKTDHECETVEELEDRVSRGMYVLLRQGSACHNLKALAKGVTRQNSRRCLLCTDDIQPKTIQSVGHIDNSIRICVREGINPIAAIQMATLNAAECYNMKDRGGIAPGLRADIVIFNNLKEFKIDRVLIKGEEVASKGKYKLPIEFYDEPLTRSSFHVKDFSKARLTLRINSDKANVITVESGRIVTKKEIVSIKRDSNNEFLYNPKEDVVKVAVIERHKNTGNAAVALLKGYGIKQGAIALSFAHDSHNIIVVGVNDNDMVLAVEELVKQGGGFVLTKDSRVLEKLVMPIAGLMTKDTGEYVEKKLRRIHMIAHNILSVNMDIEPITALSFIALPVVQEIKITDRGLFDVNKFKFIPIEAE